jgi:hypothetical protein
MADLTYIEKASIESFLGMKSGYVLDFSDRTFQEFVGEATGSDINSEKYHYSSNSKANRLRAFVKVESNYVFGRLLSAFCDYWLSKAQTGEINYSNDENLYNECVRIANRLKKESIVEHIDAIQPNSDDKDFVLLTKSIKGSIEKNEPEAALDRLHTFVVKYVRQLCVNHGVSNEKDEALNSLFGKYIKYLSTNNLLDSVMAEKILKYSINIIEAFNDIRNNKSFAHDNPILNYNESILIFNSISNTIKFIETVENKIQKTKQSQQADWTDLTF